MSEPILRNRALERLQRSELTLSLLVRQFASVDIALVAATAGFDVLYIDLEHSVISESAASQICIAALGVGVTPIVRVMADDVRAAARMLDAGAMGIVFPHVESAEQAESLVASCLFPPLGERSVAGQWPQLAYRTHPAATVRKALNDTVMIVCMLETPQSVARAGEIAAVPGVSVLHVGTNDLCDTLGIPGDLRNESIVQAYRTVIAACDDHGKIPGVGGLGNDLEFLRTAVTMGMRFVSAGNDMSLLLAAAKARSAAVRA